MAATIEVKYFNSFILRKTLSPADIAGWNGSRGDGTYPQFSPNDTKSKNWAVEEARIRGGYNNTSAGYGVKAYLVEDNPAGTNRISSLIYSGIFNSRTGINDTNVFSVGEDITKTVDPANGSIQKIFAEDTNLIIFQEKKVSNALIDKDAIYSAEGNATVTSRPIVIGNVRSYAGNFGISQNPESFAVYGNRKYFTDKDRNAVLRLSSGTGGGDGITEISNYGMIDFFRDQFGALGSSGKLQGGWDIYNKQYVLSIQPNDTDIPYKTLSFDEQVRGWTSLYTYKPEQLLSVRSNFYTMGPSLQSTSSNPNTAGLYQHYISTEPRCKFYGVQSKASIEFIFNPNVSLSKVFKTVNYEGSNGWQVDSFISDQTGVGFPNIDFETYNVVNTNDSVSFIYSYNEGSYDNYGNTFANVSTSPITANTTPLIPPINHAGFTRKENKYMANLVNNSTAAPAEVIFGNKMTGIKGYFATVKMSTDTLTDPNGMKELFAASSDYVESAY
mgnify:FL=1|tara:strand:+ start:2554 stop:4053 length:1500 start_codon:yes stop_codon:yes gene_type:complete